MAGLADRDVCLTQSGVPETVWFLFVRSLASVDAGEAVWQPAACVWVLEGGSNAYMASCGAPVWFSGAV